MNRIVFLTALLLCPFGSKADDSYYNDVDFVRDIAVQSANQPISQSANQPISPYFRIDLNLQSELLKKEGEERDQFLFNFRGNLYLSKREDLVLFGDIGQSYWKLNPNSSSNIGIFKGHRNYKEFGLKVSPVLSSSLKFRPLVVYEESHVSTFLSDGGRQPRRDFQKQRVYGLGVQYDLNRSLRKISFIQGYFGKIRDSLELANQQHRSNGNVFHFSFNSGGQLRSKKYIWKADLLYQDFQDTKDVWSISISARDDYLGSSLSYLNKGYSQIILGVQVYFERDFPIN